MFQFVRSSLLQVFHVGKTLPTRWRSYYQPGEAREPYGILCLSGLTANGALGLRRMVRKLYRHFDRRVDVRQRNLHGHTGLYKHFRRCRPWDWVSDASRALFDLLGRHPKKRVFLIGFSTGALVFLLVSELFALLKRSPRTRAALRAFGRFKARLGLSSKAALFADRAEGEGTVAGVALIVLPTRLRSRRDEALLVSCWLMYYLLIPAALVAQAAFVPILAPIAAVNAFCSQLVFSRIWVPSGDAIAERRSAASRMSREILLAVASCFACGLTPAIIACLSAVCPTWMILVAQTILLVALLIPLAWEPLLRRRGSFPEGEPKMSPGYLHIPVISTAHLIPMEWLVRFCFRYVETPMLVIIAEADAVVDNESTLDLLARTKHPCREVLVMPELGHSGWSSAEEDRVLEALCAWMERLGLTRAQAAPEELAA